MKNVTAAFWLGVMVAAAPAAAFADDNNAPQILNSSAGAVSGANRLGGPTITAPPHAWTPTGQDAQQLSITDVQKEQPRNRHLVGPAVPRNGPLPPPQAQPQDDKAQTDQPKIDPSTTTDQ